MLAVHNILNIPSSASTGLVYMLAGETGWDWDSGTFKTDHSLSAVMSAHFQSLCPNTDNTLKEMAFMCADTRGDCWVNVKERLDSEQMAWPFMHKDKWLKTTGLRQEAVSFLFFSFFFIQKL